MSVFMESSHWIWKKGSVGLIIIILTLLIQLTFGSSLANTLNLRKCHCNKYQAWEGTSCHETQTVLPIYNNTFDTQKDDFNLQKYSTAILTSSVQNVTIMELECPEGFLHTTLTGDFLLLPDGRLFWLENAGKIFTNDVFCIEYMLKEGEASFEAYVCLPPPEVPRCCPENNVLDQGGSCHPRENLWLPPIQLKDHLVEWDRVSGYMETPSCNEHENLRQIHLRSGEGRLHDTYPKATLEWKPKIWVPDPSWTSKYCVAPQEMEKDIQFVAQICWKDHNRDHKHQCNNSLCIRKCCLDKELLYRATCVEAYSEEEIWRPSQIHNQEINEEWKMVYGEPGCSIRSYLQGIHLLPDGSLQVSAGLAPVPSSQYCLDNILNDDMNITGVAMLCHSEEDTSCLWKEILIDTTSGLSCVFLVMTLVVYLGVAELRDRTYGRCLISMVTAMLIAFICLLCGAEHTNSLASCYALAFFTHFSTLATFFWFNVMCFDMWKILRGSAVQHHSVKLFLGYSLYAWGCPTLVSIITLILEITSPPNIILPRFYDGSCWFKGDPAYWAYFGSFTFVLVLANLCFFIHVVKTLYHKLKQRKQDFETNFSRTTNTSNTKNQVWLFTKLFVAMGVIWICDALSAISHRMTCNVWIITDIINSLQGVFIFIVAVCNKDNLKKIKNAWQPRIHAVRKNLCGMMNQTSQSTTNNTLSVDYTGDSRKTSITSLSQKISQAPSIFFSGSSKKKAILNHTDSPESCRGGQKNSNVSIKEVLPLDSMGE